MLVDRVRNGDQTLTVKIKYRDGSVGGKEEIACVSVGRKPAQLSPKSADHPRVRGNDDRGIGMCARDLAECPSVPSSCVAHRLAMWKNGVNIRRTKGAVHGILFKIPLGNLFPLAKIGFYEPLVNEKRDVVIGKIGLSRDASAAKRRRIDRLDLYVLQILCGEMGLADTERRKRAIGMPRQNS